ncbi:uncharacterized protein LOC117332733 [Pecten maximus]|uniref:uncharacterized protein LOC117332733 n=1 Tax=Pecten maximus TaxID=6579 RepID=UPI001458A61F|nr:uncharacterized protein LOC117332733 [Pecten maximus]
MTDDIIASHIYDVLSANREKLTERDIQREIKNIKQKDDQQVHHCLLLLRDRGLVCVKKSGGIDLWSLPSDDDDAQPSVEEKGQILEDSATGGYSGGCRRSSLDCDVDSRKSSYVDRCSPLSSNCSGMNSYNEVTKSKNRSRGSSSSSTCTRTTQQREAESESPQRLVNPTGDHGARYSQANNGEKSPKGKACYEDRLLPSNHNLRDSSVETMKSISSRSSENAQASNLAPKKENATTGTLTKSFVDMGIEIPPDTRVAVYTDLKPAALESYDNFQKILEVLQKAGGALKPAEVAKKTGIGDSKKCVNSQLYFLEKKGIVKKSAEGSPSWSLVEKCITEEKMLEVTTEFYTSKNSGASAYVAVTQGSADSRQGSGPSPGDRGKNSNSSPSVNIQVENHFHNHTHQHNYYMQAGNNNTMHVPESDGISRVENG